jgi:hypothetical protein
MIDPPAEDIIIPYVPKRRGNSAGS